MMVVDTLKCEGQCPNLMHVLAISMIFLRHTISSTHFLRYLYNNLSGPGAEELLYLLIVLVNSSSKKGLHLITILFTISLRISKLTC